MADLIQLRRDTKANWDAVSGSVILANGEVGIICDQSPLQCKVGDGVSYWNQLETQAWVGTGSLDQISSSIAELSGSLEEGLSSLEANVSYVVCPTSGSVATKDISIPDFNLSTHCRLIVKMEHAHAGSAAPTLRINLQNGTEKPLYYNGIIASSTNNWNDNEILDIYYDGTNYQSISIKDKTLYSLIESVNVGSQSSATNAFNSVPTTLRRLGLKVTYYDTVNTEWVTKQYIGSDLSGWDTESNWNNVDRFASGQILNNVSIDDTKFANPAGNALAKARNVKDALFTEIKADAPYYTNNGGTGHYKKENGTVDWVPSTIRKDVVIDVEGYDAVRFLGTVKAGTPAPTLCYLFFDDNGNILESKNYRYDTSISEGTTAEYIEAVPTNATKFVCLGLSSSITENSFYCYCQKIATMADVYKKIDDTYTEVSEAIDGTANELREDLGGFTETKLEPSSVIYGLIKSSGEQTTSQNNKVAEINVQGYDYVRFLTTRNAAESAAGYCFGHYVNGNWVIDAAMAFDNGANDGTGITLNELVRIVPSNATHLRTTLFLYQNSLAIDTKFYCYGRKMLEKKNLAYTSIDVSKYVCNNAMIVTSSTDIYAYNVPGFATRNMYVIPIGISKTVKFRASAVNSDSPYLVGYLFMKDGAVGNGTKANFISGARFITIQANTDYEIEVPKGCTAIAFNKQWNGTNPILELDTFEVENSIQNVDIDKSVTLNYDSSVDGYYINDGTIATGSQKTYFFKIESSKKYKVSVRIGFAESNNARFVAYFKNGENGKIFISAEENLISRGYNQYIVDYPLDNIPSDAEYVGVYGQVDINRVLEVVESPTANDIHYVVSKISKPTYGQVSGSTEIASEVVDSAWGFRLPLTYSDNGSPTPIIAMLHGGSGYVTPNVLGYGNTGGTATATYWKDWQDVYLDAGFAVMDVNGYGIYSDNPDTAAHGGCPMAIETLKKALEYMKAHYNVMPKMFLHGSSMGTHLAQHYIKVYSEDVISVALFAPGSIAYSLLTSSYGSRYRDRYAQAWGYSDYNALLNDELGHFYGYAPLFNCLKIDNSSLLPSINKVDATMMNDLMAQQPENTYIEKAVVPIRIWGGTSDIAAPPALYKAMYNAYLNSGANISLREIDGATHSFCTSNLENYQFVRQESVEFFKRSL